MVGVELGIGEALGGIVALVGDGLAVFTTCQINFFPLFTHLRVTVADFEVLSSFAQIFPTRLAEVFEAENASGAERIAMVKIAEAMSRGRDDFLREVSMRKTLPSNECQH